MSKCVKAGSEGFRPVQPLRQREHGFTLVELIIAVAIVGILATIAFPSYTKSVTKTRRKAAEACLTNFATHMERFYTTNLRYDQTSAGTAMNTAALQAIGLDCASAQNTGAHYTYSFSSAPSRAAFSLQAAPSGAQSTRDSTCGTLTLDQTGARGVSGTDSVANCW